MNFPAQPPIPPTLLGGRKDDLGKPQISLIPYAALKEEAAVMMFGAAKYGRDNWRKGMDYTRLIDASLRHILAYANGQNIDTESGKSHLAHARCCLAMLIAYEHDALGYDDRPRNPSYPSLKQPEPSSP